MPSVKRTLALDLGGTTGFAYYNRTGQLVHGRWRLDENAGGKRSYLPAYRLKQMLGKIVPSQGFNLIAFEETFAQGEAKLRLDSMQTVIAVYCIENELNWSRIAASSLKKKATGNGRCGKNQMVEAVWRLFPETEGTISYKDHDQADALCVLAWTKGLI